MQVLDNIVSRDHQTSGYERKKIKNDISGERKKLLETKLNSKNVIKGINTEGFQPRKILGTIFEVDQKELRQKDQRSRKLRRMH